jgi:CheY-like chemotaxis protein
MHGGTVTARSDGLGKGSEFEVRLPLEKDEGGGMTDEIHPSAIPASPLPMPQKRRVLVVDDNVDSAESMATLLAIGGDDVRTAHDGEAAVALAATFRPAVILLDLGLPKMNGYDACRQIREQPAGRGMLIIALTGWGQDEDRRRSREAGFDHHLVKPVDFTALQEILNRAAG